MSFDQIPDDQMAETQAGEDFEFWTQESIVPVVNVKRTTG